MAAKSVWIGHQIRVPAVSSRAHSFYLAFAQRCAMVDGRPPHFVCCVAKKNTEKGMHAPPFVGAPFLSRGHTKQIKANKEGRDFFLTKATYICRSPKKNVVAYFFILFYLFFIFIAFLGVS
jgi:hypothetical protein